MPLPRVSRAVAFAVAAVALLGVAALAGAVAPSDPDAPRYDGAGRMQRPADYREWVFLSSGTDMSYSAAPAPAGAHEFDNVFVPRAAYAAFKRDGVWPQGAVLMVENRVGATKGSINKRGLYQTGEGTGLEAHVKDARFAGGWAFFSFDGDKPAERIPYTAACYSCHQAHAAVDTTFVQFYPTLLPIAKAKGTLSPSYLKDPDPVEAAR